LVASFFCHENRRENFPAKMDCTSHMPVADAALDSVSAQELGAEERGHRNFERMLHAFLQPSALIRAVNALKACAQAG
jgi:hypothetical protein